MTKIAHDAKFKTIKSPYYDFEKHKVLEVGKASNNYHRSKFNFAFVPTVSSLALPITTSSKNLEKILLSNKGTPFDKIIINEDWRFNDHHFRENFHHSDYKFNEAVYEEVKKPFFDYELIVLA